MSRFALGANVAAVLFVWARVLSQSMPATAPEPDVRSGAAVFQEAHQRLVDEARQSLEQGRLQRQRPDFAAEFGEVIPPEIVGQKLARRQHADPLIDAYVRWQLTGFAGAPSAFSDLRDRQFERLLADLPKLIENPRADAALLDALTKAAGRRLSDKEQTALSGRLESIDSRSRLADELNRPAVELRNWIAAKTPKTGYRRALCSLELIRASVDAGWPADQAKAKLDELLTASARDRGFTTEQRQSVLTEARKLIGRKRLILTSAFVRDDALATEYAETGVYDFDIARWEKAMVPP